jgi:hypothetical protein
MTTAMHRLSGRFERGEKILRLQHLSSPQIYL